MAYLGLELFANKEKRQYRGNWILAVLCLASAIWSIGFAPLLLQTDPYKAYLCRTVGMIGTFLYLITAQVFFCYMGKLKKGWKYYLNGVALTGIIIYFLIIPRDQTIYYLDSIGMTYYFKKGIPNTLYTLYTILVAAGLLGVGIYILKTSKVKRTKVFAKKLLQVEMIIVLGSVLDTIFPMIGKAAIPGSTITQCFGAFVLYRAVGAMNASKINITNMSEYIYYSLSMPVFVFDADKKLHIMNDAATMFLSEAQHGQKRETLSFRDLFRVEEKDIFQFDGPCHNVDVVGEKDRLPYALTINKIYDPYGDFIGYIIIAKDLSDRMKSIQKLEEAKREAEAANEAKSIFLANMSHEIRTPMNAIVGLSELALKEKESGKVQEYLADIKGSSLNLLAIINDILDISKLESGKMELVCDAYDTFRLFQDVYLIINTQAQAKGLEFSMDIAPQLPAKLYGDKTRVRGILVNLLNNAVKYTKQGQVSLTVRVVKTEGEMVWLELKVSDTGIGIQQEDLSEIFESFSQVDRKVHRGTEGTGLGLAIVKGFVTLMKGTITVDSEYGKGSVFRVVLQQKIVDARPIEAMSDLDQKSHNSFSIGDLKVTGIRALIVDDNLVNLKVAGNSLQYYGLEVDTASGGRDALQLCEKNQYDFVFMDQMMPDMDGIQTMQELRHTIPYYAKGGACKIIVLTANAVSGMREQLMQQGFDEYLGKPINFKQLERLFRKFIPEEKLSTQEQTRDTGSDTAGDQKELQQLGEAMPEVDISQGLLYSGGQVTQYLSVLKMVYQSGQEQLQQLQQHYGRGAIKEFTILVHAMKGQLLNIGEQQVSQLAKSLEQAGKTEDLDYIETHLASYREKYEAFLSQLEAVLQNYQLLDTVSQEDRKDSVQSMFALCKKSLEEFDFAKISQLLNEIGRANCSEKETKVWERMCQLMEEMDVDAMQELLSEY